MSVITTIILRISRSDIAVLDELNATLDLPEIDIGPLGDLDDRGYPPEHGFRWGGSKYPKVALYGAAYNKLDFAEFLNLVRDAGWNEPRALQLFVRREDDDRLSMLQLTEDGRWLFPSSFTSSGKWVKVMALAASDTRSSAENKLVNSAIFFAPNELKIERSPDVATLPTWQSGGSESRAVRMFRHAASQVEAFLVVVCGEPDASDPLLNAIDWLVSGGIFSGKKVAVLSGHASRRDAIRASAPLVERLFDCGADVVSTLAIPGIARNFEDTQHRLDPIVSRRIVETLATLAD